MNFLQGVQRLCRECGVGNITSVVSQSGESLRMVDWYNSALQDIQEIHQDWGWMRASASFVTVDGQATYAIGAAAGEVGVAASTFGRWVKNSFRVYPTATGNSAEAFLNFMEYDAWRDVYQYGAARTTTSQPYDFTITPAKAVGLGPVPPAGYTVTADYFTAPVALALDADTPALPSQFHMAIVYRAMMSYGSYEAAQEVYQRGEVEFKRMMRRIERDRLPEFSLAGPLA